MKNSLGWSMMFLVLFGSAKVGALANTETGDAVPIDKSKQDFFKWKNSNQGRKASLEQMKQRCDEEADAQKNLDCSLFVLSKMFEQKAANKIPDHYQSIKASHSEVISDESELKSLFLMFGPESLSVLKKIPDFSVTRSDDKKILHIKSHVSDFYVSELVLPYVVVKAGDGNSLMFNLDTGATMTSINYGDADALDAKLLIDSQYIVGTLYGRKIPAKLGIIPFLDIGGVEFRNTLVFVDDQESVVGLDLISKLGKIKITKNALEINSKIAAHCDSRVIYNQPVDNFSQSLNFVVLLDDKPAMAIIDTGNNESISVSVLDVGIDEQLSNSVDEMQVDSVTGFKYKKIKGVLTLPKHTIVDVQYKYYPEYTIPFSKLFDGEVPSLLIGWQMFDNFELYLDIESGRSCFNKV